MNFKRALLKQSKDSPSPSLKDNHRQPRHGTNPILQGSKDFPSLSLKNNDRQPRRGTNPILQAPKAEENNRDWADLPPDLMVSILQRIHWYDVVMNAKKVCKYWLTLCKDPSLWKVVDIRDDILLEKLWEKKKSVQHNKARPTGQELEKFYQKMTMLLVDLSRTHLFYLSIQNHGSDYLLHYIYHRSRQLKCLQLENCFVGDYYYCYERGYNPYISFEGLIQMLRNLPLLEELHLYNMGISREGIEVAGCCCPHLKSFTLTSTSTTDEECDEQALAIAENMPGLQHLQLFGNGLTITGLKAILNNCHYLEYLHLRQCYFLRQALVDPSTETKLQQIKHVRLFPDDDHESRIDASNGLIGRDYYSDSD